MRTLDIEAVCTATVRERWTFKVPDDTDDAEAAAMIEDLGLSEILDNNPDGWSFVEVENVDVFDEHDREVSGVSLR